MSGGLLHTLVELAGLVGKLLDLGQRGLPTAHIYRGHTPAAIRGHIKLTGDLTSIWTSLIVQKTNP